MRSNVVWNKGDVAHIDVSTIRWPRSIARIDVANIPLILNGQGRWFAWRAPKASARTYARRHLHGTTAMEYMHRVILGLPDQFSDHRNGDGLDNRRANLREASHAENNRNRVGIVGTTSRFKGVSLDRRSGRWFACIKYEGRTRSLGHYDDEALAARVYDAEARRVFGDFAYTNFEVVR